MVWSGQIAGDGSIPRWSASKPQVVTRRKATGVFRLPVVIRIPAGLLGSLKCDPPKGNGRRQKKKCDLESSAAGATVRIAVVVQTGCGFLSGGRRGAGEDRLWESKFYIPFQPQKWASNKSNSSVTSSCACCGFLRSRLESQSWNSFNPFPHCKWGFSRCTDSARLRQDSAAKDIKTGTKLW